MRNLSDFQKTKDYLICVDSDELSNDALQREIAAQPDQVIFQKALSWSNAVNASIRELPVVAISVNAPTMLSDIPMVRTYINAYDSKPSTLDALVDNLVTGADSFRGSDPIDSFCGLWDTRI